MNQKTTPIRIAVTGGPGAGKTTLLEGLKARGHTIVPDVAREIIAERRRLGLSPRPPQDEFAKSILSRDIQRYESTQSESGLIFFDRSIVDSLGMVDELSLLTDTEKQRILAQYPYRATAFILPPWIEIYHTDSERDQSYEEAVRVCGAIHGWYIKCGYKLVEVPKLTVDERGEFVLDYLREHLNSI